MTRLAVYAISLAAGLGMLLLFRREDSRFRTALACSVVVFTAGVIAMLQQNMVGAGLVLAPPFIMLIVTLLLPGDGRAGEADWDADEPQTLPFPEPLPTRPGIASARRLLGLVRYAMLVPALAFAAYAVDHRMLPRATGDGKQQLGAHRVPPYLAVADLPGNIVFSAPANAADSRARDDEADRTIDEAPRASVAVADRTPDLDLEPGGESECLSPSGAGAAEIACDTAGRGR